MSGAPYPPTSPSFGQAGKQVLVVGHRSPIATVLKRWGIPFAVWHDKSIKRLPDCLKTCVRPFPSTARDIRSYVEQNFRGLGGFSDVIAGTESSVYVASVCRRALNARTSKDSIALRCSDKQHMKLLMKMRGIPMTDYLLKSDAQSPQCIFDRLGPKVVIKQRKNSGGRGVTIAENEEGIASRKERGLIYERYVEANEMSIETFVRDGNIAFTSTTNYLVKTHANIVPASVPAHVLSQAQAINRQVVEALRLNWGLTHAEFYWTNDSVLFGEIALRPPGGYIMECISLAHEFDSWEAFVANELDLPFSFFSPGHRTAGAVLLHAGQGTVKAIQNDDVARKLPTCVRFKLLVKPGDYVNARVGVSEVSAYGLFVSDSAAATQADVLACLNLVRFQLADDRDVASS
jgi:formate-dependent phosphoribosylglycinamide formyltransferase (GAR transformylase)